MADLRQLQDSFLPSGSVALRSSVVTYELHRDWQPSQGEIESFENVRNNIFSYRGKVKCLQYIVVFSISSESFLLLL